jgi:hypothetical protein
VRNSSLTVRDRVVAHRFIKVTLVSFAEAISRSRQGTAVSSTEKRIIRRSGKNRGVWPKDPRAKPQLRTEDNGANPAEMPNLNPA